MKTTIEVYNDYSELPLWDEAIVEFIQLIQKDERLEATNITVVLVTDEYLRNLHREYLDDDTVTDVMTFNMVEGKPVEGEIYISVDRALDQAAVYNASIETELARLIVHGLLHLNGMDDQLEEERLMMRTSEDHYLAKYHQKISNFSM